MTASRAARERKLQAYAGDLAKVKVEFRPSGVAYKIRCSACRRGDSSDTLWSSFRSGKDNGYEASVDRWVLHLVRRHPEVEAPCVERFDDAKLRADQQKAYDQALFDSAFGLT